VASREHMAILEKGVEEWNAWRREKPSLVPDLSGASFVRANLCGVDFHEANLHWAYFREADLCGANLCGANLRAADFSKASLGKADLRHTKLCDAALIGTNLSKADLSGADLSRAHLAGVKFYGANLVETNLLSTRDLSSEQLSEVKTLYGSKLDEGLIKQTQLKYPHLLAKPGSG